MAAPQNETAASEANRCGHGTWKSKQSFHKGEWRILVCEAIGTGAVIGAGAVLGLLVIGAIQ